MPEILREPVRDASAWTGADLAADTSWRVAIGEEQRASLLAGLAVVQERGLWLPQMSAADFPVDAALKDLVGRIRSDVRDGRGFIVLDGFPVEELSVDEIRLMYWGLALQLGTCLSQDARAALVADVWDRGTIKTPLKRVYGTKRRAPLHVDLADVVGLLCVRQAASGAPTTLASSAAVYNDFLRERPELLPALYEGFVWDRFNENKPTEEATSGRRIPVFSYAGGQLSCRYNRPWMTGPFERAGRKPTNEETVVFDTFDAFADRNRLVVELRPGQLYFASNYTVLHGRAEYAEETRDLAEKRHMLRIWLNMPGMRSFADEDTVRFGLMRHGNLGWTGREILARRHLDPKAERVMLEA
ncbi:MAG: TauD/TfdA family dioxygenase [Alphaproteobacteria bacterium]|nr:TauD/TfdA family dioxygenase [Alphaproteobacteria bacterium]